MRSLIISARRLGLRAALLLLIGAFVLTKGEPIAASLTSTLPFHRALVLDGVDDYAQAEDDPELDVGDEAGESLTIEAWVYIKLPGSSKDKLYIVNKPQSYELFTTRYPSADRTIDCIGFRLTGPFGQFRGFGVCKLTSSLGWHHVAGVFNKETSEMKIYVDGEEFGSPRYFESVINNSTEALEVGGGAKRLPGAVDEIRISDVARYSGSTYTVPASMFTCDEHTRGLWHFDEFEGATVFHDACGMTDNLLVGHNGAHTSGMLVERAYLPLIVKRY